MMPVQLLGIRRVPRSERVPTALAFFAAVGVDFALRGVRVEALARAMGVPLRSASGPRPAASVRMTPREARLVRCVDRGLRVLGPGQCLRRALLLGWLLGRRDAEIRIGVRREASNVRAHAWLEVDGLAFAEPAETLAAYVPLGARWAR